MVHIEQFLLLLLWRLLVVMVVVVVIVVLVVYVMKVLNKTIKLHRMPHFIFLEFHHPPPTPFYPIV